MELAKPRDIAPNGQVIYGDDKGVFAEFYTQPVYQEFESSKEGRPIYKDEIFCKITFPGDRLRAVVEKVKTLSDDYGPAHAERFPRAWAQFQAKQEQVPDGTRLEELTFLTKSQVLEFKGLKIHTVEQLAALSDHQLGGLGLGARDMREKARLYLDRSKDNAVLTRLQAELEALRADNRMLAEQVSQLGKAAEKQTMKTKEKI